MLASWSVCSFAQSAHVQQCCRGHGLPLTEMQGNPSLMAAHPAPLYLVGPNQTVKKPLQGRLPAHRASGSLSQMYWGRGECIYGAR